MSDYIERLDERRYRRAAAAAASAATTQQQQRLLCHHSDNHGPHSASPPSAFSTKPLPLSSASPRAGVAARTAAVASTEVRASPSAVAVAAQPGGRIEAAADGAPCLPPRKRQHLEGQQLLLQEGPGREQWRTESEQERMGTRQHLFSAAKSFSPPPLQSAEEQQQLLRRQNVSVPQQHQHRTEELTASELRQQALLSEEKARCLPRGRQRDLLLSFAAVKRQRAEELLQRTAEPACGTERQALAAVQAETATTTKSNAALVGGREGLGDCIRGVVTATAAARDKNVAAVASTGRDLTGPATQVGTAPGATAAASSDSDRDGSVWDSRANACNTTDNSILPVAHSCSISNPSSSRNPTSKREAWTNLFHDGSSGTSLQTSEEAVNAAADRTEDDGTRESRRVVLVQQQVQQLREVAAQQRDKAALVRGSKQRSLLLMAEKKEREAEQLLQSLYALQERQEKREEMMRCFSSNSSSNGRGEPQQAFVATAAAAVHAKQQPNHFHATAVSPASSPCMAAAALNEHDQQQRSHHGGTDPQLQQAGQQGQCLQEVQGRGGGVSGEIARLRMEAAIARDKASCCSGAKARQLRSLAELKDRQADERLRLLASPSRMQPVITTFGNPAAAGSVEAAFQERGRGTAAETATAAVSTPRAAPASTYATGVASGRQEAVAAAVERRSGRADAAGGSHSSSSAPAAPVGCQSVAADAAGYWLPPLPAETTDDPGTATLNGEQHALLRRVQLLREEATSSRMRAACVCGGRQRQLLAIAAAKDRQALELEEKIASSAVSNAAAAAASAHPMTVAASRGAAGSSAEISAGSIRAAAASPSVAVSARAAASASPCSLEPGLRRPSGTVVQCYHPLHDENQQSQQEGEKLQRQRLQQELLLQQQRQLQEQHRLLQQQREQGYTLNKNPLQEKCSLLQQAKNRKEQEKSCPPSAQLTRFFPASPLPLPTGRLQQRQQQHYLQEDEQVLEQHKQHRDVVEKMKQDQQKTHRRGEDCGIMAGRGCEEGDPGWTGSNNGSRRLETPVVRAISRSEQNAALHDRRVEEIEGRMGRGAQSEAETLGQLQQRQQLLQQQLHLVEEQLMLQRQHEAHAEQQARQSQLLQRQRAGGKQRHQQTEQAQHHHPLNQQHFDESQPLRQPRFAGQALHQLQQLCEIQHLEQLVKDTLQLPRQQQRTSQQQGLGEVQQQDDVHVNKQRQLHVDLDARRFQAPIQQQQHHLLSQERFKPANDQRHCPESVNSSGNPNSSSTDKWNRRTSGCSSFGTTVHPFFNSSGRQPVDPEEQSLSGNKSHATTATTHSSRNIASGSTWTGSRSSTATSIGLGSDF